MTFPLILLLTDYGTEDLYVGEVRLAIHRVASDARVVDLTHDVQPRQIAQGAFLLWSLHDRLPEEAVVCAVVDPGVGTSRAMLAVRRGDGPTYVAPDNGLLGFLREDFPDCPQRTEEWEAVRLERKEWWGPRVSTTFHGRDIMAPVAAALAQGTLLSAVGAEHAQPPQACAELWPDTSRLDESSPRIEGRVLHVDRFGNAVVNVPARLLEQGRDWRLRFDGAEAELAGPRETFADVPAGETLWYVGSSSFVEIAVNQGSACQRHGLAFCQRISLTVAATR